MKCNIEDMPVAIETLSGKIRLLSDQGGMAIAHNEFSEEADFGPLLAALPGGCCSVPHWCSVIKGQVAVEFTDGSSETYEAGQVCYVPAGHTGAIAAAGTEMLEFSPEPELTKTIEALKGMMGAG